MAEELKFAYVSKNRWFIWALIAVAIISLALADPFIIYIGIALVGIWVSEFRFMSNPARGLKTWMVVLPLALLVGIVGVVVVVANLPAAQVAGKDQSANPLLSALALYTLAAVPTVAYLAGFTGSRLAIRSALKRQSAE
jgi:hypothetical protein